MKPPISASLVSIGGFERGDRGRVVAGALVEVGDHAQAHRRPSSAGRAARSPRWRRGSSARPSTRSPSSSASLASEYDAGGDARTGRRAAPRRSRERLDGDGARLVDVTARRGAPRRRTSAPAPVDATSPWRSKIVERGSRSRRRCAPAGRLEVDQAAARQRQRPVRSLGLAGARERVVEPALALDGRCRRSQCGQLAPPAIVSAVSASSVATAHSSAARGCPAPGRSRSSQARCSSPMYAAAALRAQRGEVRRHRVADRFGVAALGQLLRPYCARVCSCVNRTPSPRRHGDDERLVDEGLEMVLDVGCARARRRRRPPRPSPGRSRPGTPTAARTPAARRRTAARSSSRRPPAGSAGAAAPCATRR